MSRLPYLFAIVLMTFLLPPSLHGMNQFDIHGRSGDRDTVIVGGCFYVIDNQSSALSFRRLADTIVGTDIAHHIPRNFTDSHIYNTQDGMIEELPALGIIGEAFYSVVDYDQLIPLIDSCFSDQEHAYFLNNVSCIKALFLVSSEGFVIETMQDIEMRTSLDNSIIQYLNPLAKLDSIYRTRLIFEDNGYCENEKIPYDQASLKIFFTEQGFLIESPVREMSSINMNNKPFFILRHYCPRPSNYR